MKKKTTGLTLCALLLAITFPAEAQQKANVPRIGFLSATRPSPDQEAFQAGLRVLGYTEGKNIIVEYRYAEGVAEQLSNLAAELVRAKVDLIVVTGVPGAHAAKNTTKTIPIVMTNVGDPVGEGLVANLAHPGGNITGLSTLTPGLGGKQVELVKQAFPTLSRVAVLWHPSIISNTLSLGEVKAGAAALKMTVQPLELRTRDDLELAFSSMEKTRGSALIVLRGPITFSRRAEIVNLAIKRRLPAIYSDKDFVDADGLMSYGPSYFDLLRRAATYVDKILKGAKPGDLPVEQPTKFEFVINLKTAKQIGLMIPPSVLYRADKVIK